MSDQDENAVVLAARSGDRAAFTVLVDRYWERIRRWLHALIGSGEADDLAQDVFLKAWLRLPELRSEERFRSWLFQIARRAALDGRKGQRGVSLDPLPHDVTGRGPEPPAAAVEAEGMAMLQAAIVRLPLKYRAAFLLWTQEEMSYTEIAHALEVTEITARWRVCKAREYLAKELKSFLDGPTT